MKYFKFGNISIACKKMSKIKSFSCTLVCSVSKLFCWRIVTYKFRSFIASFYSLIRLLSDKFLQREYLLHNTNISLIHMTRFEVLVNAFALLALLWLWFFQLFSFLLSIFSSSNSNFLFLFPKIVNNHPSIFDVITHKSYL